MLDREAMSHNILLDILQNISNGKVNFDIYSVK